jgi:cytoskeleton protein RodZ
MSSVGAYLRGLRERQGISLDELSRATRVLHHYLEALESDDLAALPAPVFTKGFIRAYCQAVGVPPDEALQLYDQSPGRRPEPPKVPIVAAPPVIASIPEPDDFSPIVTRVVAAPQSEPRESRSRGTLLVSVILLVVLGAAFFAVTMTLRSSRDVDGGPSERAALPEPPPADESSAVTQAPAPAESPAPAPVAALPAAPPPVVAPTPKPPAQPSVAPSLPTPSAPAAASVPATPVPSATAGASPAPTTVSAVSPASGARNPAVPYRLIARTTETTWMRVRTEDGRTSEETIPANEIREWISNGPFIITIGNAGGVSLELNGRPIPRLGASGSVITRLVLPSDNQ